MVCPATAGRRSSCCNADGKWWSLPREGRRCYSTTSFRTAGKIACDDFALLLFGLVLLKPPSCVIVAVVWLYACRIRGHADLVHVLLIPRRWSFELGIRHVLCRFAWMCCPPAVVWCLAAVMGVPSRDYFTDLVQTFQVSRLKRSVYFCVSLTLSGSFVPPPLAARAAAVVGQAVALRLNPAERRSHAGIIALSCFPLPCPLSVCRTPPGGFFFLPLILPRPPVLVVSLVFCSARLSVKRARCVPCNLGSEVGRQSVGVERSSLRHV